MSDYIVTDRHGEYVFTGDQVTNHKGELGVFGGVTRSPSYNGTAKVLVDGREYYAPVWGLTVETIADEPDFDPYEEEEEIYNWYDEEDYPEDYEYDDNSDLEWPDLI